MVSREPTCPAGREIAGSNPRYESLDRRYCGGLSSANCRPSPDQSRNLKLTHYAFAVVVDFVAAACFLGGRLFDSRQPARPRCSSPRGMSACRKQGCATVSRCLWFRRRRVERWCRSRWARRLRRVVCLWCRLSGRFRGAWVFRLRRLVFLNFYHRWS
jgi:hypothetical protein